MKRISRFQGVALNNNNRNPKRPLIPSRRQEEDKHSPSIGTRGIPALQLHFLFREANAHWSLAKIKLFLSLFSIKQIWI